MLKESAPLFGEATSLQEPRHQPVRMLQNLQHTHTHTAEDRALQSRCYKVFSFFFKLISHI